MNTMMMKMILPFCLITASLFSLAMAEDTISDRQPPAASEKPLETWPSSAKPEGPLPGTCASFLDPDMRLIDRNDSDNAAEKKKDESDKQEKEKEKKVEKKKKPRANAYSNPESTSCIV